MIAAGFADSAAAALPSLQSGRRPSKNFNVAGSCSAPVGTADFRLVGGVELLQLHPPNLSQQHRKHQPHNLDSTIEDDHNYVAAHDDDNESSVARIASSGSGLPQIFDADTPGNISVGLMHSSIDSYTSYKRVRRFLL
ncbi:GL16034 [Drosophila persimilis]|uniref:GL16034 n=1 Tax=Drosophila persimilis TaxID=7234 RepID=B4IRA7_DROPE|nr:GL16034 [Drosophila persimilis]